MPFSCTHSQECWVSRRLQELHSFSSLPERTEWGGQPGQLWTAALPSALPIPSARVVGTRVPTARAGPVIGQSFLAVVIESCIVAEHLGNRARPHLHQAHPMVTAEGPPQRHDGRWHLFIFSFLLHWIKSWKQGVQTLGNQNTTAHTVHTASGDRAAGVFGSPACQNPLCERNCSAPVGLCNWLCG